jgi:hypothetical protein
MKYIMNKLIKILLLIGLTTLTTVSAVPVSSVNAAKTGDIPITFPAPTSGILNFGNLITAGIRVSLVIASLLTFAFLIWGGIQWITSGGDKAAYESARNRITAALIGLAIVAASWALMSLIAHFFNIDFTGGFTIPSAGGQ